MKICTVCRIEKSFNLFTSGKTSTGLTSRCKECTKKYKQNHASKNKQKIAQKKRQYRLHNLDKIKEHKKQYYLKNREHTINKSTKWVKDNRNKRNEYFRKYVTKKRQEDKLFNLTEKIRHRTYQLFRQKNFIKNKSFKDYIGCTVEYLAQHLQLQFKDGMNWDLVINGEIHIDHIKPISLAKNEEEIYQLSHYTNLQPLWANENMSKGNKYGNN